jgi:hypothetical protein
VAEWVLEEKEEVKYFRLNFNQPGFEYIFCLFFTRVGGLKFLFEEPEVFTTNLRWVKANFGINNINVLKQIHSDKIYYISKENTSADYQKGDGMFTDQPNVFLSVRVADCLPIYFIVPEREIIGIVHSGRKGTIQAISLKMVKTIQEKYKVKINQISYAFGPSIGQCCYEVGKDVADEFKVFVKEHDIANTIIERNNKIFLDLKLINQKLLENLGLEKIGDIDLCSYCNKELLYSARRENLAGRNLALIGYRA